LKPCVVFSNILVVTYNCGLFVTASITQS